MNMKLNLLIVFLLGVSVSATGMRGFNSIKDGKRRLPSKSSSGDKKKVAWVIATDKDEVIDCFGDLENCVRFYNRCVNDATHRGRAFKLLNDYGSKSKSNSRRVRRLATSSSSSSSSSDDRTKKAAYVEYEITTSDINNDCKGEISRTVYYSGSESSSSSKSRRQ